MTKKLLIILFIMTFSVYSLTKTIQNNEEFTSRLKLELIITEFTITKTDIDLDVTVKLQHLYDENVTYHINSSRPPVFIFTFDETGRIINHKRPDTIKKSSDSKPVKVTLEGRKYKAFSLKHKIPIKDLGLKNRRFEIQANMVLTEYTNKGMVFGRLKSSKVVINLHDLNL